MSVRLSKEESEKRLDLRKETIKKVCLKKTEKSDLVSRVAVVLDVSSSMAEAFRSGMVQATLERLLPLAMAFDDDGTMEVWTFNKEFQRHPPLTRGNFYNYIKDNGLTYGGGTNYSPVMRDVCNYFISEEPACLPTYVIFITDGDNYDEGETDVVIKNISHFPIFFQFVGIGRQHGDSFRYLRKLDDMEGRYVDNANFFMIPDLSDINIMDDTELYTKLLDEYPKWLSYPRVREMIEMGDTLHDVKSIQLKKMNKVRYEDRSVSGTGQKKGRNVGGVILDILLEILDAFT
ncbi:VWA domain-containing protein [Ruminococcus sp.]|uniref:VWA domain-containing protein n=1 Tax=Ruminococcus sp. TaxID=41978 RepID=UPI0025FD3CDE|nr:VWA domain-containing protein [Ruminococcus sp.]MBQ8965383.1 VWA domain-containing protein [Ruminococcus sp.]